MKGSYKDAEESIGDRFGMQVDKEGVDDQPDGQTPWKYGWRELTPRTKHDRRCPIIDHRIEQVQLPGNFIVSHSL